MDIWYLRNVINSAALFMKGFGVGPAARLAAGPCNYLPRVMVIAAGFLLPGLVANAQKVPDILPQDATVQACVQYALNHYPLIQQALLDEQITDRQIKSKLADWYPQIAANAGYQNDFQLTATPFNGAVVYSFTPGTRLRRQLGS